MSETCLIYSTGNPVHVKFVLEASCFCSSSYCMLQSCKKGHAIRQFRDFLLAVMQGHNNVPGMSIKQVMIIQAEGNHE